MQDPIEDIIKHIDNDEIIRKYNLQNYYTKISDIKPEILQYNLQNIFPIERQIFNVINNDDVTDTFPQKMKYIFFRGYN
jgi:hypothetical protein